MKQICESNYYLKCFQPKLFHFDLCLYMRGQVVINVLELNFSSQARDIQEFIPLINQIIARFKVSIGCYNIIICINCGFTWFAVKNHWVANVYIGKGGVK